MIGGAVGLPTSTHKTPRFHRPASPAAAAAATAAAAAIDLETWRETFLQSSSANNNQQSLKNVSTLLWLRDNVPSSCSKGHEIEPRLVGKYV